MIYKLASAIYNDVVAGLVGVTSTPTISMEQLEQDVVDERLQVIKEYTLKNLLPKKDLLTQIRCITLDKISLDKCPIDNGKHLTWHFQIPQVIVDFGKDSIEYIGPTDKSEQYTIYTSTSYHYHKYKRRGCSSPYIYLETSPNCDNMLDCWVFNLPTAKELTFIGIIKDPRQLEEYSCCSDESDNFSFISNEVKRRLTEKKIRYYRQLYQPATPNTLNPK